MKSAVVVLGGNAFAVPGTKLTMQGQMEYAQKAMEFLRPLLEEDWSLLISHGNGPQVGHILTRVEEALGKAYSIPLEVCVAESEGELGYVLEQALYNVQTAMSKRRPIAAMLTQVVVDDNDPAFNAPEKPIGIFYTREQAEKLNGKGFRLREDAGRGYRRVVPSPLPLEIIEIDVIRGLLASGVLVIAAGGGGIPVVREHGLLRGIEAVVDKDKTAALLADQIGSELLVILTDVPYAYRSFRSAGEQPIRRIDPDTASRFIAEGEFSPGSMRPKIEAAVSFASQPGRRAIICNPQSLADALQGYSGTIIEKN